MSTDSTIGHGATFLLGRGNVNNDYDEIAEITNIVPGKYARDTPDATNMKSPARYKEVISGLRDAGDVTIEMAFLPGSISESHVLAAFNDDDARPVKIVMPDGSTTWRANGFVNAYEPAMPLDGKMTAHVSYKITGEPGFI